MSVPFLKIEYKQRSYSLKILLNLFCFQFYGKLGFGFHLFILFTLRFSRKKRYDNVQSIPQNILCAHLKYPPHALSCVRCVFFLFTLLLTCKSNTILYRIFCFANFTRHRRAMVIQVYLTNCNKTWFKVALSKQNLNQPGNTQTNSPKSKFE